MACHYYNFTENINGIIEKMAGNDDVNVKKQTVWLAFFAF